MGSIIRSTGIVFCSLLYLNSHQGFNGLKCVYSVISVIVDSLPGNTKNRESTRSWTAECDYSILGRSTFLSARSLCSVYIAVYSRIKIRALMYSCIKIRALIHCCLKIHFLLYTYCIKINLLLYKRLVVCCIQTV